MAAVTPLGGTGGGGGGGGGGGSVPALESGREDATMVFGSVTTVILTSVGLTIGLTVGLTLALAGVVPWLSKASIGLLVAVGFLEAAARVPLAEMRKPRR